MRQVRDAMEILGRHFSVEASSGPYPTLPAPPAPPDGPSYANAVIRATTTLTCGEVRTLLKHIETTSGRMPHHKACGRVVIDIDLVVYGGEICRMKEFEASYFRKGYDSLS